MSCLCCHRQSWTYPKVFLKRPSFVGKNTAADWLLPIKTISVLSLEMSRLPFLKYQLFLSTQTRLEIARRSIKINRVWVFGGFFDFFFFFFFFFYHKHRGNGPTCHQKISIFVTSESCPEISLKISSGVTLSNAWQPRGFQLHHPPLRLLT